MTQSGQGEEPSARPAREGIVLPSDGGEPLLPGMTNASYSRPRPHEERRRVLQQLGEQVHEVGHGTAVDLGLRDAGQL
ncbi:hypothetical protein ABT136_34100, partial [Streptomyces sp. NPDC001856]|uniref:hypothetical protein n=1 Tax=Streptomyces sp. NPDC001856 TaxID=3154399 RepID=UPI003333BB83